MSERSFVHNVATVVLVVAAASCSRGPTKPEADPAKLKALATQMIRTTPAPAAAPACTQAKLAGAVVMTQRTALLMSGGTLSDNPEYAEWIHPTELDAPAARVLIDPAATTVAKRQAAAELLQAPRYLVYQVTMVNVPMALGVKELKRGAVGMRAIGYDKTGVATCVTVFTVQNDREVSERAMDKSDRATMDPAIIKELRDDLRAQVIKTTSSLVAGLPP
ncbi:MAG: hypothetical protein AB7P03_27460 [Kofleriaceae bacterium]